MRHTMTIQSAYHLFFRHLFSVCLACLSALLMYPLAHAVIATDGSMGPATTLTPAGPTGQDYTIPADLGQQNGTNLFHSFGTFNVNTGESATFTGPTGTTNVIGRVTGGNASWIDGLLACSIPGANLWLLNPFGILFGPNASLDVNGSFHASTADYLQLSDGGVFYTDPSKTSKLTTAPPSAFGFLSSQPADIHISGSSLAVPEGETISIIGGDIRIENGHLVAPGGRVNLATLGSQGTVEIAPDGLTVTSSNGLGNISISNSEYASDTVNIDVSGSENGDVSGSVDIYCKTFSLNNSEIRSENYADLNKGGNIQLVAEKSASIDNSSLIFCGSFGTGSGGDIDIQTGYLAVTDGGQISSSTYGRGDGGNVTIQAKDVLIEGVSESRNGSYPSAISCQAKSDSTGNAGNLVINTESLTLSNAGLISAATYGSGDGGNVTIQAKDVLIEGGVEIRNDFNVSMISCQTGRGSTGNAGSLNIDTDSLTLSNGGQINAATYGTGDGGDVNINAKAVLIDGVFQSSQGIYPSLMSCQTETFARGNAGSLNIDTESLTLSNGGQISAGTYGTGDGGDVTIHAKEILIDGGAESSDKLYLSDLSCQTHRGFKGNAGSLSIDTESLTLSNGGQISVSTFGHGDGGDVTINANEVVIDGVFEGSQDFYLSMISCQTNSGSSGNAGSLNIYAESLTLSNGGQISAATLGRGSGGDMNISANDILIDGGFESGDVFNPSKMNCQTGTGPTGDAGNLVINTETLTLSDGGQISASTFGHGDGGDVTINAKDILIDGGFESSKGLDPSRIVCVADEGSTGNAGNLIINTESLTMSNGARIETNTAGSGDGGNMAINAKGSLYLSSGAIIAAASSGTGDAGSINLTAGTLEIRDSMITTTSNQSDGGDIIITTGLLTWLVDSTISASVNGGTQTTGGNIRINSPNVVLDDSQVIANAYEGKGGSIGITAETYLADWTSTVSASSTLGISGQVDINSPLLNLSGLLSPLPAAFVDISELLANDCETRYKHHKASSLVIRGRDALPAQPGDLWPSPVMMQ